ncbi:uncharacterized protein BX663DRAFT_506113, partial [Cokeromyces recurvatus]|uniref:uncharacterized protein n=1 Tax=Cokeromyces recurvatus TaxID=90255 RepID=UPI00221F4CDF
MNDSILHDYILLTLSFKSSPFFFSLISLLFLSVSPHRNVLTTLREYLEAFFYMYFISLVHFSFFLHTC